MPSFQSQHYASLPIWFRPGIVLPLETLVRTRPVGFNGLAIGVSTMCSNMALANLGQISVCALPRYEFLATSTWIDSVSVEAHDE